MSTNQYRSRPTMDYASMGYLATPFYPKWKTTPNRDDVSGCQMLNLYPRMPPIKQQRTSPYQGRPLPYPKCSPYYGYCGTMLETHPSAFHPQKAVKRPLDVMSTETLDRSCYSVFYEDRRMCTCHCSFPTSRSPPCLENFYKREGLVADQHARNPLKDSPSPCFPGFYRWFLPNSRYSPEDIPIGLRLSSLTTHSSSLISPDDDKRPAPKRFQCTHCEKSFGKSSHLRDHIRTHTGDRPYRCQYCDKAFTQYSNLRTHTRIHTGEKPYRCRHCNKSFTQAVTLRSHTRTHTGDKPYHCKHCTKSFACFSGLKGHIRVHEGALDNVNENTQSIKKEDTTDEVSQPEDNCERST